MNFCASHVINFFTFCLANIRNRSFVYKMFHFCFQGIQLTSSGIPEDSVLARAMVPFDGHGIDVFSCSWGPPDVGFKVQGPGPLTRRAFLNGVIKVTLTYRVWLECSLADTGSPFCVDHEHCGHV